MMNTQAMLRKNMLRKKIRNTIILLLILALAIIMLLPLSWMLATSLRKPADSYKLPPSFFPTDFRIENYINVLTSSIPYASMFKNSIIVATIVTISQLITCSMAAFSFGRLKFRGRSLIFAILLATMMVPMQVTIIPLFLMLSKLKLTDSLVAITLPYLTGVFGIFLLRQFVMSISKELDEAAKIDGAGYFTIYSRIIMPLCKAPIAALGILTFLNSWNNYFVPLIFLRKWDNFTLPLGIASLQGYMGSGNLSEVMAGVATVVVPVAIVFMLGQKYFIEGIAMTGIKG